MTAGARHDHPDLIQISIEPRWTHDGHQGEIEIEEREVAGMTEAERQAYIEKQVEIYVNEECPWGWSESEAGGTS
jgi:hypothetical protein